MIAKGLDFPDVELVGVISAEDSLAIPDFRAAERTFQLLTQVAGRAGRREARGRVIVQGIRLDHYAVKCAVEYDYPGFFEQEREIRRRFGYPPFKHLARVVIACTDYNRAVMSADMLGDVLRRISKKIPQVEVLGPAPAPLEHLKGRWRRHLVFKSDKVGPISKLLHYGLSDVRFSSEVGLEVDVDPLNMM
jgi:primosomal protein N' (replication factor Y)